MHAVRDFLLANEFRLGEIDPEDLLRRFDEEMTRGLNGSDSSLAMIPSYITADCAVPVETSVAAIDAGGTNLRAAVLRFDAQGTPHMDHFSRYRMPGTEGRLSAERFYSLLADAALIAASNADRIGFCFSYPAEVTPEGDARLLRWVKQVQAPDVVGTRVGSGLREALARRGCDRPVTVLNDTVATLLAGKSVGMRRRYSSYVGFIHGTGTNTAYAERHSLIRKCPELDPAGAMIVNVESGNFGGAPRSRLDKIFDATTADTGSYPFEKMLTGAYLGGLGGVFLKEAAQAGLFTPSAARALTNMAAPSTKEVDDFSQNPFTPAGPLADVPWTDDDRRTALVLVCSIFERAAIYAAVNVAAAVLRTRAGQDPLQPVAVNIDGTTYHLLQGGVFKVRVQEHLRRLLQPRGIHCDLLNVDHASLIGAAVAALTRQPKA